MCAKLNQFLSRLIPEGPLKDAFTSSYYKLYYNRRHFGENEFYVYYRDGYFIYRFENGVEFASYQNMADELKRSLKGYLARYPLKTGDIVVDCGAYIGEFALYAAKAVGSSGRVVAFEPDREAFRKLEANVRLNGLANVTTVNKGVWSCEGVLKFVGDAVRGYSFMIADKGASAVDIPVVRLDAELARLGIRVVNFIKVDVEGAEIEFIKGAAETLKNGSVNLAIASYHEVAGRKTFTEIERMLTELGYRAETSHPRHLTTYGWKEN
ncbi:MAG: FkbM family methyltransferase [Candidatus Omnitrophica bacterium]|nr:FkbM family methyltransferase [Candidatus Omnitrophota bacterium]MCM8791305.1 FkbM family methyltransferase [Candidatus Omnitrophota bacterium]